MGSKLCENKEKKRYDYVAGLLTGGFRAKNLTTKDVSLKSGQQIMREQRKETL